MIHYYDTSTIESLPQLRTRGNDTVPHKTRDLESIIPPTSHKPNNKGIVRGSVVQPGTEVSSGASHTNRRKTGDVFTQWGKASLHFTPPLCLISIKLTWARGLQNGEKEEKKKKKRHKQE